MKPFRERLDELHSAAIDHCQQLLPELGSQPNFGDDNYAEALDVLLRSLDNDAQLSDIGQITLEKMLVGNLSGRLYSEHFKKLTPQYSEQKIIRPLFIIGLPRSGTTALHKLLCSSAGNQGLEYWLGSYPMPRPARQTWNEQLEFQTVSNSLNMLYQLQPALRSIHEMLAEEPDECRMLLMQNFANVTYQSSATVSGYEHWLYQADLAPMYRRYKENLQLIGVKDARRWVLKDPSHLWSPDALLEAFPDACIIQTHRSPEQLIPSVASLTSLAWTMNETETSKSHIGQHQLKQWNRVLQRLSQFRRQHTQLRICDVYWADIVSKPLQVIEQIYQFFDIPFDTKEKEQMRQWTEANPRGKHGQHNYTAGEFGLSREKIRAEFETYISKHKL